MAEHQCDRYSLGGLPGVSFCRKDGARIVHERLAFLNKKIEELAQLTLDQQHFNARLIKDGEAADAREATLKTALLSAADAIDEALSLHEGADDARAEVAAMARSIRQLAQAGDGHPLADAFEAHEGPMGVQREARLKGPPDL